MDEREATEICGSIGLMVGHMYVKFAPSVRKVFRVEMGNMNKVFDGLDERIAVIQGAVEKMEAKKVGET